MVVGSLLWLLAVVPAFELFQIFLAEAVSVAIPLFGFRSWRVRRFHFRLADLFLITVVAGGLLAKNVPENVRHAAYPGWGAACGCAALAGYFAVTLSCKWWLRIGLLFGLPMAAATVTPVEFWLLLWDPPEWLRYVALPLVAIVVASCLVLFRAARAAWGCADRFACASAETNRRPRGIVASLSLAVLLTLVSLLPALAFYQIVFPTPIPVATLPAPNAYVELTRVGEKLISNNFTEYKQQLDTARMALGYDSLVPVAYEPNDVHLAPTGELRALLRAWALEARAAEKDRRYDEACDAYLDIIRAGAKISRGGFVIEWTLSGLFLKEGLDGIQRVRGRLSPSKLSQSSVQLRALEAAIVPVEQFLERDRIYAQYAYGWQARLRFLPIYDFDTEPFKRKDARWLAEIRLLECDLAARRFEQQRDALPERLDDLAPELLPRAPLDPYSERPLIYRRLSGGFVLYSVGPDQIDNGGIRAKAEEAMAGEDLLLTPTDDGFESLLPEGATEESRGNELP